jgi:hypothetical protein
MKFQNSQYYNRESKLMPYEFDAWMKTTQLSVSGPSLIGSDVKRSNNLIITFRITIMFTLLSPNHIAMLLDY